MDNTQDSKEKHIIFHVNSNIKDDCFVGIKVNTNQIKISFPLGFRLNETNECSLREDSRKLFSVLSEFSKKEKLFQNYSPDVSVQVNFPIYAYLTVIRYYISHGYFIERESSYSSNQRGTVNWSRTIRKEKGIISEGNVIYTNFMVKKNVQRNNGLLTQINRYCVEESFSKIGWMFLLHKPEPVGEHPSLKISISILSDALLNNSNVDETRRLLKAMKDMLQFLDKPNNNSTFSFGVNDFRFVWQQLIDKAFGVDDISSFFPHGYWFPHQSNTTYYKSSALQEDSIMDYNGKLYILDAKFYKYGDSGILSDLPPTDSIQKQLTYGDYVQKYFRKEDNKHDLFNAFLMPFDKNKEVFKTEEDFKNVAEAMGDWRRGKVGIFDYYERIQGVLIDTRYLMYHYNDYGCKNKEKLAACIQEVKNRKCPVIPNGECIGHDA